MSQLYRIVFQGHLDSRWSAWFDGLTLTQESNGESVLTGPIADQAALYGVLSRIRDLGLPLLGVHRIESETGERSES